MKIIKLYEDFRLDRSKIEVSNREISDNKENFATKSKKEKVKKDPIRIPNWVQY